MTRTRTDIKVTRDLETGKVKKVETMTKKTESKERIAAVVAAVASAAFEEPDGGMIAEALDIVRNSPDGWTRLVQTSLPDISESKKRDIAAGLALIFRDEEEDGQKHIYFKRGRDRVTCIIKEPDAFEMKETAAIMDAIMDADIEDEKRREARKICADFGLR